MLLGALFLFPGFCVRIHGLSGGVLPGFDLAVAANAQKHTPHKCY
jgi:hypothetical protein